MIKKMLSATLFTIIFLSLVGCSKKSEPNILLDMITNKDSDKKILFLAESQTPDYPTTKGDMEFAKLVKERTKGRIEIQVVANGGLGSEKDTIAQAQIGTIDFLRVSLAPLANYSDMMNILSLPYIYRDESHMHNVLDGPIGTAALKQLETANLTGLGFYDSGARSFYNNKKEIKTLSDLKDLRIRVQESELMKLLVSSLGATPTALDSSAVMGALAVGQIDGAENNPATYVSSKHFNIAKYYTIDEHSRIPDILVASTATMKNLSPEDQQIVIQAAKDSVKFQREEWKKDETIMLNKIKEAGCKVTELDNSTLLKFKEAVTPVYEKFGSKHKELIKQIEDTK